jgi:hypothetical protein
MKLFKNNWFKILAVILLLWALAHHPYGYYQFLRWLILGVSTYSAYLAYNSGRKIWIGIFGIIALLFNPIIPFYFQRDTWQFIDIITAVLFLVSMFEIRIYERKG